MHFHIHQQPPSRHDYDHDDVIKWEPFPCYWPFVRGIHWSPVNSPHKGHWRGALMFSLICTQINGWVYNREAGDLRRHRAHYDVIVILVCHVGEHLHALIHWYLKHLNCPKVNARRPYKHYTSMLISQNCFRWRLSNTQQHGAVSGEGITYYPRQNGGACMESRLDRFLWISSK